MILKEILIFFSFFFDLFYFLFFLYCFVANLVTENKIIKIKKLFFSEEMEKFMKNY